jgi:hypothetical protein
VLKVVYVPDGDAQFVVPAIDRGSKALAAFRRRPRRRGRR